MTETRTVIVEREIAHPRRKDLARADATAPHRGVAHEERLQAGRGPQVQPEPRARRPR